LEPVDPQKHALECLRLQAECMELMAASDSPDLRAHFLQMAGVWADLADRGPLDTDPKN
jgi:hypothetical protein